MTGVSSGIEPVYEFSFIRRDRLGEHTLYHPLYEEWKSAHPNEPTPSYFVSANDLTPEDHVKVQAAIQKYVDASISKTVNAPKAHTVEEVKKLYMMAYDLGCKGVTYMRDGSRPGVLERIEDKKKEEVAVPQALIASEIKPRPMVVHGSTYQIDTPVGSAFVTINMGVNNQPLEIFVNVGKGGSDLTAMSEAVGRLASLVLRLQSPVPSEERARQIQKQLSGIGGSKSLGFGDKRVRSLPDAVAKVIATHMDLQTKPSEEVKALTNGNGNGSSHIVAQQSLKLDKSEFDLCPKCGDAALAYEEGCKKCYSCGYSEC
jgi:ribonucleoside-diphosphate reductase alpha chain